MSWSCYILLCSINRTIYSIFCTALSCSNNPMQQLLINHLYIERIPSIRGNSMIPNQWYCVLESKEVKKGKMIGVKRFGQDLLFWRTEKGTISCIKDQCAHRGAALSGGKVTGDHFQCPYHGLQYDTSGTCVFIPSNGKAADVPPNFVVQSYPVREDYDFVWVWWGNAKRADPQLPLSFFKDIGDFSYATFCDDWPVHYSRAIENTLDPAHLPFVHHNTIGRGNKTLIHGPLVELESNEIKIWVFSEVDKGQVPLTPEKMRNVKEDVFLHFIFPNVWCINISDNVRIVLAFVPVDDKTTTLYMRSYQGIIKIPGLRTLAAHLLNMSNRIILNQDKRVVITQRPKKSALRMNENLVQADLPIVYYRRRREELKMAQTTVTTL